MGDKCKVYRIQECIFRTSEEVNFFKPDTKNTNHKGKERNLISPKLNLSIKQYYLRTTRQTRVEGIETI